MNGKYIVLAGCDFKCLEQCIKGINRYKYRDIDAIELMGKLFDDIKVNEKFFDNFDYVRWNKWKKKKGIDLDDSNNAYGKSNPFMRGIYYILWGKRIDLRNNQNKEKDIGVYENGWGKFSKSYLFDEEKLLLGGDTMNTIASYRSNIEQFRNISKENSDKVDELCRMVHQMGNFVLVPAYFNNYRGVLNKDINDCMDSSLCYLKKNSFEFKERLRLRNSKKSSKEEKKAFAIEHFAGWESRKFSKYINIFFLWDYVYAKDNEYYVRNLKLDSKGEHRIEFKNDNELQYKVKDENVGIYIKNAETAISRRSIFMTAMLMLAVEFKEESYKEEWTDWHVSGIYKEIVEKIFLKDTVYEDFNSVINKVKEIIQGKQCEEVIKILDTIPQM